MSDEEVKLCKTCDEPVTRPRAKYCERCRKIRQQQHEQRYEPRQYPQQVAPPQWYEDWNAYVREYGDE